jgi:broad specificity phosphatase PhoE
VGSIPSPGTTPDNPALVIRLKTISITYFVHSSTIDSEKGLATGWLPGTLSKPGIRQAKELAGLVSHQHFDAVFCSDLKRAIDSAEICFGAKYQVIQDKRLRECNYGDFNRKSAVGFKNNLGDYIERPFPNGESYKDVGERISGFLDFLKKNYTGKHIAIVAHQAPQLALDVIIKEKTWQQAIEEDWRNKKAWQPGWEYEFKY